MAHHNILILLHPKTQFCLLDPSHLLLVTIDVIQDQAKCLLFPALIGWATARTQEKLIGLLKYPSYSLFIKRIEFPIVSVTVNSLHSLMYQQAEESFYRM